MMLIDHEATKPYRASGAWGRVALDMLVHRAAQAHPEHPAIADAPDRLDWTGGAPRSLTFGELDREIDATAAAYRALGLEEGAVVGLFSPNTVDTVVALLGGLRAGLIVAPMPLTWRSADIQAGLDLIGAKAVIAADRLEDAPLAEIVRDTAVNVFGVRFVLGLGDDLPDGVAPFAEVCDADGKLAEPAGFTADHVATITWTEGRKSAPQPLPRSHNQWIATGLMHLLEGRIEPATVIASAFAPTGLVGIGAVLVPWLLTGGTLNLSHFRSLDGLAGDIAKAGARHAILPEPLVDAVAERLDAAGADQPAYTAVWRNGHGAAGARIASKRASVDIFTLDEWALVASLRAGERPSPIPIGPVNAPRGTEQAPILAETRLVARQRRNAEAEGTLVSGEIAVSGAMVPEIGWPGGRAEPPQRDDAGFVRTGLFARPVSEFPVTAEITGRGPETASLGGLCVPLDQVQRLIGERPDATKSAAFSEADRIVGARLRAAVVGDAEPGFTAAELEAYLDGRGVALHKRPHGADAVSGLPVRIDGGIDREALARRFSK